MTVHIYVSSFFQGFHSSSLNGPGFKINCPPNFPKTQHILGFTEPIKKRQIPNFAAEMTAVKSRLSGAPSIMSDFHLVQFDDALIFIFAGWSGMEGGAGGGMLEKRRDNRIIYRLIVRK